jgi:glycosyltransferase involved in cell wall biosynthesis
MLFIITLLKIPFWSIRCGTPVIAYERGGALEPVAENKTGIFFKEQIVESLIDAVKVFEKDEGRFDFNEIRKNAERFSKERFKREFREFVDKKAKFLTMLASI